MERISKVDIQVNYPDGWKTVCTVESLQEHLFLGFVSQTWGHLDRRVITAGDDNIVWDYLKGGEMQ